MKNRQCVATFRWLGLVMISIVSACTAPVVSPGDSRLSGPKDGDLQRILAPPRPPQVLAIPGQPVQLSPRAMARLSAEVLSEQRGSRNVQIAAVPLLRSTPEGAAFLNTVGHRALAQGEPTVSCPALSVAPPNAPSARLAAEVSLTQCTAQLTSRRAPATCGCRLIALDNALLAPIQQFAFAPAVSALMISDGTSHRLIAEADLQDGIALTRLRNAGGEVGVLRADAAGDGITGTINGITYDGIRRPFGFRRGRLAERLTLVSPSGERATILVGVERRDATPKN